MSTGHPATAADASASCVSPCIEKKRNQANELLKRGIREREQSLAQNESSHRQIDREQSPKKIAKSNERTIERRNSLE